MGAGRRPSGGYERRGCARGSTRLAEADGRHVADSFKTGIPWRTLRPSAQYAARDKRGGSRERVAKLDPGGGLKNWRQLYRTQRWKALRAVKGVTWCVAVETVLAPHGVCDSEQASAWDFFTVEGRRDKGCT
jgi:hypothetical protein